MFSDVKGEKVMKVSLRLCCAGLLGGLLMACPVVAEDDEIPPGAMFRYVNEAGVRVMSHQIPPQYVANGYEILSRSGQVLRVVPPAPTEEEAARLAEERRLAEEQAQRDRELRRRYGSVAEIEAARDRVLQELQFSINVLQGNLSGVRSLIEEHESRAANFERAGREVPEATLETIAGLQREEVTILEYIRQREQEYQSTGERFESDMERFRELQAQRQQ